MPRPPPLGLAGGEFCSTGWRAWGGSIGFRAGRIAGGAAGEGVRLAWGMEGQAAAARPELLAQAPELALASAELRLGGFLSLEY